MQPDTWKLEDVKDDERLSDFLEMDEPEPNANVDEPDPKLLNKPARKVNSVKYQKKADKVLGFLTRIALSRPNTVADGAALLMYGPNVAESFGNLAAENAGIARAIDMLESGADSPTLAVIAATTPLLMQIARNHEKMIQPKVRTIPVPFTKRIITLKRPIGIKLGIFRETAHDPEALVYHVLSNADVQAALKKNGVNVSVSTTGK